MNTSQKPMHFKYALCNELYGDRPLDQVCANMRELGYTGIEIAPFTLTDHVDHLSPDDRAGIRATITRHGLTCTGLHWLLASPPGLHITTTDLTVREKSWEYLRRLADLCRDLGGEKLVLGSPAQRSTRGLTPKQAADVIHDGLRKLAPYAADRGVQYLLEPIVDPACDVITSMREASAIVKDINHPGVALIFDFTHTLNDPEPREEHAIKYSALYTHVHATTPERVHCGAPGIDRRLYAPIWPALKKLDYNRWISLEVFDFKAGADTIAREGMEFFQDMETRMHG